MHGPKPGVIDRICRREGHRGESRPRPDQDDDNEGATGRMRAQSCRISEGLKERAKSDPKDGRAEWRLLDLVPEGRRTDEDVQHRRDVAALGRFHERFVVSELVFDQLIV